MKSIHGKTLILLILFLNSLLSASSNQYATYSIKSSKRDIYVNEPIFVTFHARQKTKGEVMFFDFTAQNDENFKIVPLKSKRHEFNYHDAEKTFEFLVFAKKAGDFRLKFDFQVRRASDDAVAQAYNGSRDNVKSIPTIKVKISSPYINLHVKAMQKNIDAVGEFRLTMSIDKLSSNSYDAVNVKYKLTGKGYLDESFEPLKEITNTSVFRSQNKAPKRATKDGFIYNIEYNYAIVAKESYTLSKVSLNTFSYTKNKPITINIDEKNIKITKLDINNLVDDKDVPQTQVDLNKYIDYFYGLLIFIAGFLSAKLLQYLPKNSEEKEDIAKFIKQSKTEQELLKAMMPLLHKYSLNEELKELEKIVYNKNAKLSFREIKSSAIKKIN